MTTYLRSAITAPPNDSVFWPTSQLEFQSTTEDPTRVLPNELLLVIFSHLNISELGASRQVCRRWNRIAGDDNLWKNVIYREIAFSNKNWAECFGSEVVAHEDCREEFASLPWKEYMKDSSEFHRLFPGKRGKDHLVLVRLPKTLTATRNEEGKLVGGLTLNSLGQLAKDKFFPETDGGYKYIAPEIFEKLGNRPIDKSRWVMMTKCVLAESRGKPYWRQKEIVNDLVKQSLPSYNVPQTLEAATCILSQCFYNETFLYGPGTYTRCQERIIDSSFAMQRHSDSMVEVGDGSRSLGDDHIYIGGFDSTGLLVDANQEDSYCFGISALRRF